jgi:hypothetical protein
MNRMRQALTASWKAGWFVASIFQEARSFDAALRVLLTESFELLSTVYAEETTPKLLYEPL